MTAVRAWVVRELGRPEWVEDHPEPALVDGSVLVDVQVAAPNFADSLQLAGRYQEKPPLPFVAGIEYAGRVRAAAPGTGFSPGERVVGLPEPGWGAWGEVSRAPAHNLTRVPNGTDLGDAVAVHVNFQTSWFAIFHRGGARAGDTVLVHAAAGGVGSAAVQLAVAKGCRVIATCSASKAETARALGADEVLDSRDPAWIDAVKDLTRGRGVDVVVDPVGGDAFDGSTKVIAFEGRLVTVGYASGRWPTVAANHLLVKNYAVVGLYWGRYLAEGNDVVGRAADDIFTLLRAGRIDPMISERGSVRDAPEWTARVAAGETTGKVVLNW
jgi:NADPH:quinone reductase